VLADGQVVASREKGVLAWLSGGGWPDARDVVETLRLKLAALTGT
jgi:hypothetical protein